MNFRDEIFRIRSERDFRNMAIELFHCQFERNPVYRRFVSVLQVDPALVKELADIPFIPVSLFKTHRIIVDGLDPQVTFLSSGTTGMERSRHLVADTSVYTQSLLSCFAHFYGDPAGYIIFALVPDPKENPGSSLAFMVDFLMESGREGEKNFFSDDFPGLHKKLISSAKSGKKRLLIGLTSSLLDFSRQFPAPDPELVVMETGGMKGKGVELIREELHDLLSEQFGVTQIHSEYGMTELLSQAYSRRTGLFSTPPWMKIMIRDTDDPFAFLCPGRTGGINVIDLANFNSCPFIATQDLGKLHDDGQFEVLGRFDNSELRGCNLMAV